MLLIDNVMISIIIVSSLVSLLRGFVREVLSLLTWISACFVVSNYYRYLAVYLIWFKEQMVRNIFAIACLFIAIMLIGLVVNCLISALVEQIGLSSTNRILGFCFGALRGIVLVSAVLFLLDQVNCCYPSNYLQHSQLIPKFSWIVSWFFDYI